MSENISEIHSFLHFSSVLISSEIWFLKKLHKWHLFLSLYAAGFERRAPLGCPVVCPRLHDEQEQAWEGVLQYRCGRFNVHGLKTLPEPPTHRIRSAGDRLVSSRQCLSLKNSSLNSRSTFSIIRRLSVFKCISWSSFSGWCLLSYLGDDHLISKW